MIRRSFVNAAQEGGYRSNVSSGLRLCRARRMPTGCPYRKRVGSKVGSKVGINPKGVHRYPLDISRINLYSGRVPEQLHGENQSSDILVPNQDAFHPSNGATLDSDPVTGF